MGNDKGCRKEIISLGKSNTELMVVIDTLQIALKRCENTIKEKKDDYEYVFTQSAKWSMKYGRQD